MTAGEMLNGFEDAVRLFVVGANAWEADTA
jgi:hypothetical protein